MGIAREVFWKLHAGLPKQGPGSDASTARALALCGALPPAPRILDLGCGSGRQSITLARLTGGLVTAVDLWAPSLATLRDRAEAAGLGDRIETLQQRMGELRLRARALSTSWGARARSHAGLRRGTPRVAPAARARRFARRLRVRVNAG